MSHNQFNNEQHTLIQSLFIQAKLNEIRELQGLTTTFKPHEGVDKLWSKIGEEADKLMQLLASDSADYKKYLAMKAYTYLERGYKRYGPVNSFDLNFLETALELFEPIKQQQIGVRHNITVLTGIGLYYRSFEQYHEAIKYLKKAEKEFELFKTNFSDIKTAMDEFELFDACNSTYINYFFRPPFSQGHNFTIVILYECYKALNNVEMKLKYVIPSIKSKFLTKQVEKKMKETKFCDFVPSICAEIHFLIISRYFAQVDHLLAGSMYQLVKNRRELPEEDQPGVKHAQAIISKLFAFWASETIGYSILSLKDKAFAENHPIFDEIYHFAELIDEGAKIYVNQFPCKPFLVRKEFEKYWKRAVLWCQRAIDLYEESHQDATDAKDLMKLLDSMKSIIDDFKELK